VEQYFEDRDQGVEVALETARAVVLDVSIDLVLGVIADKPPQQEHLHPALEHGP
jgi:hypothetical protein